MSEAVADVPSTDTALTVIPRAELVFVPGGAQKVLSSIKRTTRERAAKLDVSRPKDRVAIKSLAYQVRRLKTTGDNAGKDLKAEYQAKINPIDAERRVWREEMDALADEVSAPVDAFEARETERITTHEHAITEIANLGLAERDLSAASLTQMLDDLAHLHVTRDWQEFEGRAASARLNTHNALRLALIDAQAREAEEAEAERLAAEQAEQERIEAERLQVEREAEIARQAAETARLAAEEAAAQEAIRVATEAATREAAIAAELAAVQQRAERAEQERLEAEQRVEAGRVAAYRAAINAIPETADYGARESSTEIAARGRYLSGLRERDWEEFAEEATKVLEAEIERTRTLLAAAQTREAQALEAERVALAAVAVEEERQRVEGMRILQEALQREREANIAHKRKINSEAVADLVTAGLSEAVAKMAVTAIAKHEVRHVTISY